MAIKLEDYISRLPQERQAAIENRSQELIAEETTLSKLRDALHCSQAELAGKLGVNQSAVSKMERRGDVCVSTLRDYVKAMGCELELVVRLPNKRAVRLNQF